MAPDSSKNDSSDAKKQAPAHQQEPPAFPFASLTARTAKDTTSPERQEASASSFTSLTTMRTKGTEQEHAIAPDLSQKEAIETSNEPDIEYHAKMHPDHTDFAEEPPPVMLRSELNAATKQEPPAFPPATLAALAVIAAKNASHPESSEDQFSLTTLSQPEETIPEPLSPTPLATTADRHPIALLHNKLPDTTGDSNIPSKKMMNSDYFSDPRAKRSTILLVIALILTSIVALFNYFPTSHQPYIIKAAIPSSTVLTPKPTNIPYKSITPTVILKATPSPVLKPDPTAKPRPTTSPVPQVIATPTPVPQVIATPTPVIPTSVAKPTTPAQVSISYEAEAPQNTRASNLKEFSCPLCSGGERIGWIYGADTLRFNAITAQSTKQYTVSIYYYNSVPNRVTGLFVSANSNPAIEASLQVATVNCCDYAPYVTSVSVTLQAGTNTITVSNPNGPAPDIDRIVVQP